MRIIRHLSDISPDIKASVATIGNFDGVHIGHQAILAELLKYGVEQGLPPVVISFEPTPREFFAPAAAPPRLTGLREKFDMLESHGMQYLLLLRFNRALAELSAEDFIRKVLVDGLHIRHLLIGDDFRFGHGRRGDHAMLAAQGEQFGFTVAATATQTIEGERVSSTRVRAALASGDLDLAATLLGRRFRISGRVAHGDKLGRQLGFPTINIRRRQDNLPLQGIFLVRVYGIGATACYGVASVGTRPTVDGRRNLVEVYLFDFDDDLYGRTLDVEFLEKLRDEHKFPDLDSLRDQIRIDVNEAMLRRNEWQKREHSI